MEDRISEGREKKSDIRMEEQEKRTDIRAEEWEKNSNQKKEFGGRRRRKEKRLTGSLPAKTAAFFLLVVFLSVGAASMTLFIAMADYGFYTENLNAMLREALWGETANAVDEVMNFLSLGEVDDVEYYCQNHNIDIEISYVGKDNIARAIWSTCEGDDSNKDINTAVFRQFDELSKPVALNGHLLETGENYLFRVYIDPNFPIEDSFRTTADFFIFLYKTRMYIPFVGLAGISLGIICFIFLMSSAGHRNGYERIVPGVLTGIHLDVLTLFFGGAAIAFTSALWECMRYCEYYVRYILLAVWGIAMVVWMTIYFMDFALRVKLGKCWRHTLIYRLFHGAWRIARFLYRGIAAMVKGIPLVITTLLLFLAICIVEFMGMVVFRQSAGGFLLWLLLRVVLLIVIMYIALTCVKLLEASRALAEGQENYVVDTSKMFGDFKEHGENLNSLGEGISKAVAERMKSEHLKTELITNVSHDIKTPLTSIINYADLIYEEAAKAAEDTHVQDTWGAAARPETASALKEENAVPSSEEPANTPMTRIREYSQVLLRQSGRMKKLLEDLVEASKATTGNLEVNLEPCEAGVLLSQAVGEYQQKMEEKGLDLIAKQPEEPVKIMADGRHLWRVFDNLLNNICKYAQENTRVYLSLEMKQGQVLIIFRNMSKYPLDISGEELEERFVRGDKSRHMEGNGLGLSIAKSLVELQKGRMDIVIDGDLFKVILSFPLI